MPAVHECHMCGKVAPSYIANRRHMETHLAKASYLCMQCGKKFGRDHDLFEHIAVEHGESVVREKEERAGDLVVSYEGPTEARGAAVELVDLTLDDDELTDEPASSPNDIDKALQAAGRTVQVDGILPLHVKDAVDNSHAARPEAIVARPPYTPPRSTTDAGATPQPQSTAEPDGRFRGWAQDADEVPHSTTGEDNVVIQDADSVPHSTIPEDSKHADDLPLSRPRKGGKRGGVSNSRRCSKRRRRSSGKCVPVAALPTSPSSSPPTSSTPATHIMSPPVSSDQETPVQNNAPVQVAVPSVPPARDSPPGRVPAIQDAQQVGVRGDGPQGYQTPPEAATPAHFVEQDLAAVSEADPACSATEAATISKDTALLRMSPKAFRPRPRPASKKKARVRPAPAPGPARVQTAPRRAPGQPHTAPDPAPAPADQATGAIDRPEAAVLELSAAKPASKKIRPPTERAHPRPASKRTPKSVPRSSGPAATSSAPPQCAPPAPAPSPKTCPADTPCAEGVRALVPEQDTAPAPTSAKSAGRPLRVSRKSERALEASKTPEEVEKARPRPDSEAAPPAAAAESASASLIAAAAVEDSKALLKSLPKRRRPCPRSALKKPRLRITFPKGHSSPQKGSVGVNVSPESEESPTPRWVDTLVQGYTTQLGGACKCCLCPTIFKPGHARMMEWHVMRHLGYAPDRTCHGCGMAFPSRMETHQHRRRLSGCGTVPASPKISVQDHPIVLVKVEPSTPPASPVYEA